MKALSDFARLIVAMILWSVALIVLGVVLRINWELFLIGWSAL